MMTSRLSHDYLYSYHVVFKRLVRRKRHNKRGTYEALEPQLSSTVINSSVSLSLEDIESFIRKANTRAVEVEIISVDEIRR